MTGKRGENSMEIRAYIIARSLLRPQSVNIHGEVWDIYGEEQMSHRSVCRRVAKFKAANRILKMPPIQVILQQLPQKVTLRKLPIYSIRMLDTP